MTIKAIIFDLGGVLLQWSPLGLYQKHFPHLSEAEIKTFLNEVDFTRWNLEQDRGRSFEEGVTALSEQFPHYAPLIRAYDEHWLDCLAGPIHGSVTLLERLKADGVPVYGLTNFANEKFVLAQETHPFLKTFADVVVSSEVRLVKPDPAIYHLTLERIGYAAQECVFIDDHLPNVEAARALGFAAIHFQSPPQLAAELQGLGLLEAG